MNSTGVGEARLEGGKASGQDGSMVNGAGEKLAGTLRAAWLIVVGMGIGILGVGAVI